MRITNRRTIIFGLLLVQALSLLALFFVSGRIAAEAEAEHQDALLSTESAEAVDRMRAYIQPAESIVQFASNALVDPSVDADALLGSFREAMETSPQLDGVFVGSPDGGFVYLSREGDGYRLKQIDVAGDATRTTQLIELDAEGNELSRREDPQDEYDPTQRPWYQLASASPGTVSWTDPYVFFTSRQLGISSATPVVRDGEVVGVVGADIELGSLSSFLTSLDTGTNGGAIIVSQDGVVIAHPDADKIQRSEGGDITTVSISALDDELARAAIASYVEAGVGSETALTSFEAVDLGPSQGSFRTVPVGAGTWTVGVFGPEGSLVSGLASARAAERTLLAVAGFVGLLLAAAVFSRVTRPLDELEKHAWSDSLTGLPNRRKILRGVDSHIAEAEASTSVAMLDVDRFKSVNDTYGHQVGDEVLAEVARRAAQALPEGCSIGRIGGEEFLVLMPDHGSSEAMEVCERIRGEVRATPVQHTGGALEVTVSLGLATSSGGTSRGELMAVADVALLEAKSSGRDKVVAGKGLRIVGEAAS